MTHRDEAGAARDVFDETVELKCFTGHRERIALKKLFVWRRTAQGRVEYVYWRDRARAFPGIEQPSVEWPPVADEVDGQLRFRWNPGYLDGETERTALRLRFPANTTVRGASVRDDALYRTLLVPGDAERHEGLPVRWEWRDCWQGHGEVWREPGCIHYRRIQFCGLPFAFHWPYPEISLRVVPGLAVGIYPKQMHPAWKPYRVAALSNDGSEWVVKAPKAGEGIACAQDTEGWPEWIAVEGGSGDCGSSWQVPREEEATNGSGKVVSLGIDFGTTATVVYFCTGEQDITTEDNALRSSDFRHAMHWLSPAPPSEFDRDGWFFPWPPEERQDPCLIPTALWVGTGHPGYIRWAGQPPGSWSSSHGFKWDDGLTNRRAQRIRFLQELLFFSLPCVLERLGNRRARPQLKVGLAYPLAFSFAQREDLQQVTQSVSRWLSNVGGFQNPEISSLNESLAAVRAFGAHNPGEEFLVADLGGRTLDVTLLQWPATYHQIGSLDFGGEAYLNRVASDYWELRREVFAGRISHYGSNRTMVESLEKFHVMALEYLRLMLAAHRQPSGEFERPVKVVLIGNGWRLRDLTAGDMDPNRHFRNYYQGRIDMFELGRAEFLYCEIFGVNRSKHWVAIGALKHAAQGGGNELEQPHYEDKLPAGRKLRMGGEDIDWQEMVGVGGHQFGDPTVVRNLPCDVDFVSGPAFSAVWKNQIDRAVAPDRRDPRPEELRDWLFGALWEDRLLKGPLQLILEKHWKRML